MGQHSDTRPLKPVCSDTAPMNSPILSLPIRSGLLSFAALIVLQAETHAQSVLTFDDLGISTIGVHMTDGYGGFQWNTSNWHFLSNGSVPGTTHLALSGTATSIRRTGGVDFIFQGAEFWSRRGLDATGSFYFILSRDGATVYDGRQDRDGRQRFTGARTLFRPNYDGPVDSVAVVFTQGGGDWDHLAMDNFRFGEVTIPTPVNPPNPPTPTPTPNPPPPPTAPGTPTAPVSYKVAIKTNGKGSVAVSRTGTSFLPGTVLTLTATPAAGSPWVGWSGAATGVARTITVTVDQPLTIQANFR